jgi:phosphoribosylformylglycinamidine synthase
LKNEESVLVRIDLSKGQFRLGGSILAQVYKAIGSVTPDVDSFDDFKAFFALVQDWNNRGVIKAYHDIGDGGLLATVAEMMFAARLGVALEDQSTESYLQKKLVQCFKSARLIGQHLQKKLQHLHYAMQLATGT